MIKNGKREAIETASRELSRGYADFSANLPCKEAVRDIIRDIRGLLFSEYFECFCPGENLKDTLGAVYDSLYKEVTAAFLHSQKDMTKEEAEQKAESVCCDLIEALPKIKDKLNKDVEAGFFGDPAAKSREDIIISYPGMLAIFVYRVAHELYVRNVPLIPRIMTEYAHSRTGIDIHPGATIGRRFFIDHGTGVVIGETTTIGHDVKLYQHVTLGAKSFDVAPDGSLVKGIKRHPDIGNNVVIYSGATILGGDTKIGSNCVIGGNVWLTESVKSGETVLANPGEHIRIK